MSRASAASIAPRNDVSSQGMNDDCRHWRMLQRCGDQPVVFRGAVPAPRAVRSPCLSITPSPCAAATTLCGGASRPVSADRLAAPADPEQAGDAVEPRRARPRAGFRAPRRFLQASQKPSAAPPLDSGSISGIAASAASSSITSMKNCSRTSALKSASGVARPPAAPVASAGWPRNSRSSTAPRAIPT